MSEFTGYNAYIERYAELGRKIDILDETIRDIDLRIQEYCMKHQAVGKQNSD